jgi:hypothetical protein
MGTPWERKAEGPVFRLAWRGYPVRLRFVLAQGRVSDIFVYRADF